MFVPVFRSVQTCLFLSVCEMISQSVTFLMGGNTAMAFSLRRGPWQKFISSKKDTVYIPAYFWPACAFKNIRREYIFSFLTIQQKVCNFFNEYFLKLTILRERWEHFTTFQQGKVSFFIENILLINIYIYLSFKFWRQYFQNGQKHVCNGVSATSAFNVKLCHMAKLLQLFSRPGRSQGLLYKHLRN